MFVMRLVQWPIVVLFVAVVAILASAAMGVWFTFNESDLVKW